MTAPVASVEVKGIDSLVSVVPYLVGFHPTDSVVLVSFKDHTVYSVLRVSVPHEREDAEQIATALEAVLRAQPDRIIVIGYASVTEVARAAAEFVTRMLGHAGFEVASDERAVVVGDRWCHCECDCCPAGGSPIAHDSTAALDMRVATGFAPAASRDALVDSLEPTDARCGLVAESVKNVTGSVSPREVAECWDQILHGPAPISEVADHVLAVAASGVDGIARRGIRDAVLTVCCPSVLPLDDDEVPELAQVRGSLDPLLNTSQHAIEDRLSAVCRCVTDEHAGGLLSTAAVIFWSSGNGALANVAVERALRADPESHLARLVSVALTYGVRPDELHQGSETTG